MLLARYFLLLLYAYAMLLLLLDFDILFLLRHDAVTLCQLLMRHAACAAPLRFATPAMLYARADERVIVARQRLARLLLRAII